MSSRVHFQKLNGKLTEESREFLADQYAELEDGYYTNDIHPGRIGYTPSRYKHYHDCILWAILSQAGHHYRLTNPDTGEERQPRSTGELHELIKAIYNPIFLVYQGKTRVIAGTTTDLTDRQFIDKFQEDVMSDHAGPPFNVEYVEYELWKQLHKEKKWGEFKKEFKPQTV